MARRGRKPKSRDQKLKDALERNRPPLHIEERRKLYSFVRPPVDSRQDGRNGEIDSEVCDGIGRFQVLGLLDGHGYNSIDLRDRGREWRNFYVRIMKERAAHASGLDAAVDTFKDWQRRVVGADELTAWERERFEKLDSSLGSYEREVLMSLLIDPVIGIYPDGQEDSPWVKGLIDEALLKRGRIPKMMVFPTESDRNLLRATIRGLCCLVEGSLPGRYERRAA